MNCKILENFASLWHNGRGSRLYQIGQGAKIVDADMAMLKREILDAMRNTSGTRREKVWQAAQALYDLNKGG